MLALGAVFVGAVAAILFWTYTLTQQELLLRSDKVLATEVARLSTVPTATRASHLREALTQSASGLNYFALLAPDGHRIAGNLGWHGRLPIGQPVELPAGLDSPVTLRVLVKRLPDGQTIAVARDMGQLADIRARILLLWLVTGSVVIVAASAAAIMLSLPTLRRISMIRLGAKRIAAGDFAHRMPETGHGDELDVVSHTINGMVEDIERLMGQVKGATDAIAHDLRAPLARLRFGLTLIEDRSEAVERAVEEIDMVLTRFDALLRIAELEAAGRRAGFAMLDPMVLLTTTAELYEPLAEERECQITLNGLYGLMIEGDEALLVEAIGNLVDNAIKFGPRGGKIRLDLERGSQHLVIAVSDRGPGIPPVERDAVLRSFYRGASGRQTPGSGLGLSLVATIAHLHGFGLELDDARPGLVVRLQVPIPPVPPT